MWCRDLITISLFATSSVITCVSSESVFLHKVDRELPYLLPLCFLLLRFLDQLPYIMREIGPNGFPLSIGRAADVLYIKLRPVWAHTDNVIFVTAVIL